MIAWRQHFLKQLKHMLMVKIQEKPETKHQRREFHILTFRRDNKKTRNGNPGNIIL